MTGMFETRILGAAGAEPRRAISVPPRGVKPGHSPGLKLCGELPDEPLAPSLQPPFVKASFHRRCIVKFCVQSEPHP